MTRARKPEPSEPTTMATTRKRRRRARPTPRWLVEQQDLDEIARRRCLMVLTVLSGVRSVTDVIEEAQISRGTYYQLELKAVRAMVRALTPGQDEALEVSTTKRIAELEAKLGQLGREKQRAERLMLLTKALVRPGPVKTSAGGRPRKDGTRKVPAMRASTPTRTKPSATRSTAATGTTAPMTTTNGRSPTSTSPGTDGEGGR